MLQFLIRHERVMDQHKANLRRLKEAGVTRAVGSDFTFRDTSRQEALLLHDLGVFTNLELLKMWCDNSPLTIFPDRNIRRRFKLGQWLDVSEPAPAKAEPVGGPVCNK